MDILQYLGIYADAIETAVKSCQQILEEAKDLAETYGTEADFAMLQQCDIDQNAKTYMRENLDVDNMTNSIITAYFDETTSMLNSICLFGDLGIGFSYYVNCNDSYINIDANNTICSYNIDELKDTVQSALLRKFAQPFCDLVKDWTHADYPIEFVQEDIRDDAYCLTDMITAVETKCIPKHILTHISNL